MTFALVGFGNTNRAIKLQEVVPIDLRLRGSGLKTRYTIRFSTEEKRNNFKILAKEKDIEI